MKYLTAGLAVTVLILIAILIFRKPDVIVPKFDEKPYRDSISKLQTEIGDLHDKNDSLLQENFVINNKKEQIKIIYREKYKYIRGATTHELDSVIRANW
jgi:hypothetical protein